MNKVVVLSVVVLAWSSFTLWTVKKLWRTTDDPQEAMFWAKVKVGSLAISIGSSLLLPTIGDLPALSYWSQVGIWMFLLFPAGVWVVYLGSRWFQAIIDQL